MTQLEKNALKLELKDLEVKIVIPRYIIHSCIEYNISNPEQIKDIYMEFLDELIEDDYHQTETDFDNWLDDREIKLY